MKYWLKKLGVMAAALGLFFLNSGQALAAIPAGTNDHPTFYQNLQWPFYDPNSTDASVATVCGVTTYGTTTVSGTQGGMWNSGLQPPYILEQFAIETLKDVAKKMGVPESSTVTQEHVVALVAFMFGEGGDINNQDLFNPLNTGLDAPDLIDGAHAGNGVQSFKSFDAGVEATARTIVGSNQNRLASVLIQPDSTANQFMYALAYYDKYPGNLFWAEASKPPNQDSYYQQRLQLVQQVKSNYNGIAGLIIGTPAKEFVDNLTDPSKLQFGTQPGKAGDGSTATNAAPNLGGCNSGVVAGSIVQTALGLAWPSGDHGKEKTDATQAYQIAMPKYNGSTGDDEWSDCGVFTSTVMIASGADPNYPKRSTSVQADYVKKSGKYLIIPGVKDTSQLQPGDILIYNNGSDGHTFIYVGQQSNFMGDGAAASLHGHVPQAVNSAGSFAYNGRGASGLYLAARLIK